MATESGPGTLFAKNDANLSKIDKKSVDIRKGLYYDMEEQRGSGCGKVDLVSGDLLLCFLWSVLYVR